MSKGKGEKRGRGQPTKLTEVMIERIAMLIRSGVDVQTAAEAVGVSRATFYVWIEAAKKPKAKGLYKDFFDMIVRASAEARARLVTRWSVAADKDWRAAQALLAHLDPDRFSPPTKMRIAGEGATPPIEGKPIVFFIPAEEDAARDVVRAAEEEAQALEEAEAEEEAEAAENEGAGRRILNAG